MCVVGPYCVDAIVKIAIKYILFYSSLAGISINPVKEADPQAPTKLKLQLFPINEATRKALEKVNQSLVVLLLEDCI